MTPMQYFLKAEAYRGDAYLTADTGEIWRVWSGDRNGPLMERLTEFQVQELEATRRQEDRQ